MTQDGKEVQTGDTVWVFGSIGDLHATKVKPTVQVTDYYLFGNIPVSDSFSTKKAAQDWKNSKND